MRLDGADCENDAVLRLSEIQLRDPFVFVENGIYYLTGSTDPDIWQADGIGFDIYQGIAPGVFTEFVGPFKAFRPQAGFWSRKNFWAPELHRFGDGYYLFATFLPEQGHRGTAILRADSPLGPFTPWSDGPVTPADWECLDGTLHLDETGDPWMVFCHEWMQVGDGQVCAMRLSADLKTAAGKPKLLFTASQAPWSAPLAGHAPGSYVTDGPFLYRWTDDRLSIVWSSFGPQGNYCIGEAVSETGDLAGPWTQRDRPLYEADGGHGMLFSAPDDTCYLAIHTPNQTPHERAIFVEIVETADGLAVGEQILR